MGAEAAEPQHAALPAERRAHPRYAVDEDAVLLFVTSGARMRCRILDLSFSGCRLKTPERFPLGIYTRIETEFRLAGIAFRLGGVIQAIHKKREIGIRFLDMSERKRQQVRELVEEIRQMRNSREPVH